MKKLTFTLCALCAAFLVSCGGSSSEAVNIIEEGISKVEDAKTASEIREISKETKKKVRDFAGTLSKEELKEIRDDESVKAAEKAFEKAAEDKAKELLK